MWMRRDLTPEIPNFPNESWSGNLKCLSELQMCWKKLGQPCTINNLAFLPFKILIFVATSWRSVTLFGVWKKSFWQHFAERGKMTQNLRWSHQKTLDISSSSSRGNGKKDWKPSRFDWIWCEFLSTLGRDGLVSFSIPNLIRVWCEDLLPKRAYNSKNAAFRWIYKSDREIFAFILGPIYVFYYFIY